MQVIVIAGYNAQPGELKAVVEVPEFSTDMEVFVAWMKKNHPQCKDINVSTTWFTTYTVELAEKVPEADNDLAEFDL